jgi:lipopolysaccharide transport system permease protein
MVVFTVVFGRIAGVSSDGVPYPIFAFSGLVLWTFFAQSVSQASNSLVNSADLVRKVYFPRLLVPVAAVVNTLFDLVISLPALGLLVIFSGTSVSVNFLVAPLMVVLAFVAALGISVWFSALNVAYRDIRHLVPFVVQLWLFLTPVIYPVSFVSSFFENHGLPSWLYGLNPMVGSIHGFRWALFGDTESPWTMVITSASVSVVLLGLGALYFRHVERTMADVV